MLLLDSTNIGMIVGICVGSALMAVILGLITWKTMERARNHKKLFEELGQVKLMFLVLSIVQIISSN